MLIPMPMISVKLPDGTERKFKKGSTPLQVAESIGRKLAKDAVAAKVDGKPVDLTVPLESDCELVILTFADREGKEVFWHSTTHLMAQAVKQLFPEVKLAIGPPVDEGFYYDFERKQPFTPEDLKRIEERMEELAKKDIKVEKFHKERKDALSEYQKQG